MSRDSAFYSLVALIRPWLFPLGVGCLYGIGLAYAPEETGRALSVSGVMFRQLGLPICFALVMMVVLNRFLSPAMVTRFLGQGSGIKGAALSALAGIVSMGPIYAWYPFFKTLKEKGAASFHIASFMSCRSVKPVLFPVMVAYFGWRFTMLFVAVTLVGAVLVASVVGVVCRSSSQS